MNQEWMNHPDLASLDIAKLQLLQSLANQGAQKGQQEMLPFLMMAMKQTRKQGLSFSADEINLIIDVLKKGKSEQEVANINKMIQLLKTMRL